MNINYIGEHVYLGTLGRLLTIIGFVTSLLTAFSYFQVTKTEQNGSLVTSSWKKLARGSYIFHAIAIITIFILLYSIISNHFFEFNYAYSHSSKGLKPQYLFSSFWEGSEGSFMLWTVWNAIWGLFLMKTAKSYESRVMVILAIVQAALCTLQMGAYFGDIKIGSNAFNLLRDEKFGAPIFNDPDYLSKIDGHGLNALLQNYWMVIHPPVLFCGFSLMLFPFTYAIAALWKGEYKEWVRPALRWSLAAGGVLGLGIMMGGAWAYESLTFGGYWAWDPVENASLVPWLVMVAAIHTLLIYRSTGRSLKTTFIFIILAYVLIWYSTFLTRTGILGDTSVHSFTGEGSSLKWHLVIVIMLFLGMGIYFMIDRWKKMPVVAGEEETWSRDFWMLIGSIFLFLSSLQIIVFTSQPVLAPLAKLITGKDLAPPLDVVGFYNSIQVWAGIIIASLTAFVQFLKYKHTDIKKAFKNIGGLALLSAIITAILCYVNNIPVITYILFLFSGIYAFLGNIFYLFKVQRKGLSKAGGSIAHIGFGMIIVGILFSSYKKQVISMDATGHMMDFGKKTYEENLKESRENVQIFRNTTMPMGDYSVTYLGDSVNEENDPPITYFNIRFDKKDPQNNNILESFVLKPDAYMMKNAQMGSTGLSSNPHYRRYWNKDIFTYISSMSDPAKSHDTSNYHNYVLVQGDSIYLNNGYLVFKGFEKEVKNKNYQMQDGDVPVALRFEAYDLDHELGVANPVFYIRGNSAGTVPDTLATLGVYIRVDNIEPSNKTVAVSVRQRNQQDDWVVIKVVVYPYIDILWLGVVVMVIGFIVSWFAKKERLKKNNHPASA